MPNYEKLVVIGASAGGIDVLKQIFSSLPADFPAPLLVVQHLAPYHKSELHSILNRRSALEVVQAKDAEVMEAGKAYVAPPDHHLLVEKGQLLVTKGPKENRFRPSIDALFRSAAYHHGEKVIGVILSGALNDGTSGMWNIHRTGGTTVIQDPAEADFDSMPASVKQYVEVDYQVKTGELSKVLVELTNQPAKQVHEDELNGNTQLLKMDVGIARNKDAIKNGVMEFGEKSSLSCPECHGALQEFHEGKLIRYRCHTGHAYTLEALLSSVGENIERNMWQAMRGMEENIILLDNMARQFRSMGMNAEASLFAEKSEVIKEKSRELHSSITDFKI